MLTAFREKQLEKNPPFDYLNKMIFTISNIRIMWKATFKYKCPSPTPDQLNQNF